MNIRIVLKGIEETRKALDSKIYEKAMRATCNDLAGAVKTEIAQQIGQRYTLPSKRIKDGIKVKEAQGYRLRAEVTFISKPPGLQNYKAQQKLVNITRTAKGGLITRRNKRQGTMAKGVQVEVIRGQKRIVSGAFLMSANKGVGIYRRVGKERTPVKRLYGPSIKGMFMKMGGKKIAEKIIGERLLKAWYRNVERYTYKNK